MTKQPDALHAMFAECGATAEEEREIRPVIEELARLATTDPAKFKAMCKLIFDAAAGLRPGPRTRGRQAEINSLEDSLHGRSDFEGHVLRVMQSRPRGTTCDGCDSTSGPLEAVPKGFLMAGARLCSFCFTMPRSRVTSAKRGGR